MDGPGGERVTNRCPRIISREDYGCVPNQPTLEAPAIYLPEPIEHLFLVRRGSYHSHSRSAS